MDYKDYIKRKYTQVGAHVVPENAYALVEWYAKMLQDTRLEERDLLAVRELFFHVGGIYEPLRCFEATLKRIQEKEREKERNSA